jgi:hypothetical protein
LQTGESEDKTVLRQFTGRGDDASMDSINSMLVVLSIIKIKSKQTGLSFMIFISVIRAVLFQRMPLFERLENPGPPPATSVSVSRPVFEFVWRVIYFGH